MSTNLQQFRKVNNLVTLPGQLTIDWFGLGTFVLPFVLYVMTLAPTIYNLDSAEFSTAVATDGIVRATGYPLYLTLGKLWTYLPVGDIAYRLNLFSAFCGAGTIFLAEHILRRFHVTKWPRIGALGLLMTAPYFWAMSLIAEVYTLHTFLMAGIILSLLYWSENPIPRKLFLPALLLSLSAGNHAATVLLIPGFVWFIVVTAPKQLMRPKTWLIILAAGLLGASIFLTMPLRYAAQPAFNYAGEFDATGSFQPVNLQTWDGFLWLVTGKAFAGQMFGYQWAEVWGEVTAYGGQLWQAFLGIGIGPAILGAVVLLRRDWRKGGFLLLLFGMSAIFYINYRVMDKNTMFLPTYLVWALWLGIGYQVLLNGLAQSKFVNGISSAWVLRGIMATAVVCALLWTWQRVDLSNDFTTRDQSEETLTLLEENAILLGWWDTVPAIQYLQMVEGRRPDVLTINRFLISGEAMNSLIATEIKDRPIYINSPPLAFIQAERVKQVGKVYQLMPPTNSRKSREIE